MKQVDKLIIIFLLMASPAFGQTARSDFKFSARPDSVIEKRQEGYIYITSDTTSELYDRIVPRLEKNNLALYSELINDIRTKYKQQVKQFPVKNFPRKWNSVYLYKNEYFLYGPSDWMMNRGFFITDSVVYITESDISDVYLIKNFKRDGQNGGAFKTVNYSGETVDITIRVVEKSLGVYEWTMQGNGGTSRKFFIQN